MLALNRSFEGTVSVTGHRCDKLGGYGAAQEKHLVAIATSALLLIKPEEVITGMALGWDKAIAIASTKLNIPWTAAIPFQGQELKWPTEQQILYRELLKNAQRIVIVSEGGYAAWKLLTRNKWMVDNSKEVVALWNGDLTGGTAHAISYAKLQGKTVKNMWNLWLGNEIPLLQEELEYPNLGISEYKWQ